MLMMACAWCGGYAGMGTQGEDARAAMLLYRARREEWEKELRKKHVHKYV